MKIERVTVTATPTSIQALMNTQRAVGKARIPSKCNNITMKYDADETKVVLISDSETTNKVTVLDNSGEKIRACSFDDWDISLVLLSVASGTVEVDIIISQKAT